jgi:lysophospholipase L1-like esterase
MSSADKPRLTILRRLLLGVFLSVFLVLCLLELGLRYANTVFIRQEVRSFPQVSGVRLLCVGDSYVYGLGAKSGFSYPAQLQTLFDRHFGRGVCAVDNFGRPGQNSSEALVRLNALFSQGYHADFALITIGANNAWNWRLATPFLPGDDAPAKIRSAFSGLRVYRLFAVALTGGPRAAAKFWVANDARDASRAWNVRFMQTHAAWLYRWLKSDLTALGRLCAEHDVQPILVGYHDAAGFVTLAVTQASVENDWPRIDFRCFGRPDCENNADLLSSDRWHPNEKGYAFIARFVGDAITPLIEKKRRSTTP